MQINNLKYADPTNTLINMDVTLDEATANQFVAAGETIPFTYHPDDNAPVSVAVRDLLAGGGYTIAAYVEPPAPPVPVPESVTRRQMLIGMAAAGLITTAEAIASAQSGAVPAAVEAVFNSLPTQADKDAAAITWASMSVAERANPLVAALAAARGLTDEQVDDLFRAWSVI